MSKMIDYNEKVLQVKNLKKYFKVGTGRHKLMIPAVDDVSIDVYKREVFGVVGESGSGKTTLGRTIIKLYQPTDGTVTLNNIIISAGIQGYYEKINQIKRKLKNDILRLNPSKIKAIELRQTIEKDIQELIIKKQDLIKQRDLELTKLSSQFDKSRSMKYQVTALMELERQKVIFDFNQKVMKAKQSQQNEALLKFNNDMKKDLFETQRLLSKSKVYSDKTESLFVEVRKSFNENQKIYDRMKNLDNLYSKQSNFQ
jgi:oligopeptide transport system ATP-binding protein